MELGIVNTEGTFPVVTGFFLMNTGVRIKKIFAITYLTDKAHGENR